MNENARDKFEQGKAVATSVSRKAALEALWNHSSGAFGVPGYTKMVIEPEQAIAALRSLGIEVSL